MSERLTWAEIERRYPDEHVLLIEYDWREDEIDPRSGVVCAHAKTLRELARLSKENPAQDVAFLYVGEIKSFSGPILSS